MVQIFLVTSVWSPACLTGQVSRVTAGHSSLSLTEPVRATDTSRFLHQTPWLPRVELVVSCLEHLLYVTYQLKNIARHLGNNGVKAGEVTTSDPDLAHTSVLFPSSFLFLQRGNMQALCEGVIRHILYRKVRGMVGYSRGWKFTCFACTVCLSCH